MGLLSRVGWLLPVAGLCLWVALAGCERDFDSPFLPDTDAYAGSAWTKDYDGDGVADSIGKYAPDCRGDSRACLSAALARAAQSQGPALDSVVAEDMELAAGGAPVPPRLRCFPPGAGRVGYTLVSGDARVARAADVLVEPLAAGTALFTLTVRTPGSAAKTARFRVTVIDARILVTSLSAPDMALRRGESRDPGVVVLPADAGNRAFGLKSRDPGVAAIRDGMVLGTGPGTTRVTVEALDGSGCTAAFQVKVAVPVEGIAVEDMAFGLVSLSGKPRKKTPIIAWDPEDAADKRYSLVSDDPEVAQIEGESVRAKGIGETIVTLITRDGGKQARFRVTVSFLICDSEACDD